MIGWLLGYVSHETAETEIERKSDNPIEICGQLNCITTTNNNADAQSNLIHEPNWIQEREDLNQILPGGIDVIGISIINQSENQLDIIRKILSKQPKATLLEFFKRGRILIGLQSQTQTNPSSNNNPLNNGEYYLANLQDLQQEFTLIKGSTLKSLSYFQDKSDLLAFRTRGTLNWTIDYETQNDKIIYAPSVKSSINTLKSQILSPETSCLVPSLNKILNPKDSSTVAIFKDDKKKQKGETVNKAIIEIEMFRQSSNAQNAALSLQVEKPSKRTEIPFHYDIITFIKTGEPISNLVSLIKSTLARQIDSAYSMLSKSNKLLIPKAYHFKVSTLFIEHLITPIYLMQLNNDHEDHLKSYRQKLHLRVKIPEDRPAFRIFNTFNGNLSSSSAFRIKSPHLNVGPSGVENGIKAVVKGDYLYYHYCQDGFDDKGWGCSYRSLQTICSYLLLQNYTAINVPSHREVQQILVNLNDKDPSFVGSKKMDWVF